MSQNAIISPDPFFSCYFRLWNTPPFCLIDCKKLESSLLWPKVKWYCSYVIVKVGKHFTFVKLEMKTSQVRTKVEKSLKFPRNKRRAHHKKKEKIVNEIDTFGLSSFAFLLEILQFLLSHSIPRDFSAQPVKLQASYLMKKEFKKKNLLSYFQTKRKKR